MTKTSEAAEPVYFPKAWILLFSSAVISGFGDQFTGTALPVKIYASGGGVRQLAWLGIVQMLPFLLVSPLAGMVADRNREREVLIACDALRCAVLLLMCFNMHWWTVIALALVAETGTAAFTPTEIAYESRLLNSPSLLRGNSLRAAALNANRILGPFLAGLMVNGGIMPLVFGFDSFTFLASGVLLFAISSKRQGAPADVHEGEVKTRGGWNAIRRNPALMVLLAVQSSLVLVFGLQGPLIYEWTVHELRASAGGFGYLMGAMAVGGLLGAWIVSRLKPDRQQNLLTLSAFLSIDAGALFKFVTSHSLQVAACWMMLMGMLSSCYFVLMRSSIQWLPPESDRGRVAGFFAAARAPVTVGSLLLIAPAMKYLGTARAVLSVAAVLELATAFTLASFGYLILKRKPQFES